MATNDFDVWKATFLGMARSEEWVFKAQGREIDAVEVFASAGFAPGLLAVAQRELDVRGFGVDLDLYLSADRAAGPLGVSVSFGDSEPASGALARQYWRLAITSFVLDSLRAMANEKQGNEIVLDPLFAVFKPTHSPALSEV